MGLAITCAIPNADAAPRHRERRRSCRCSSSRACSSRSRTACRRGWTPWGRSSRSGPFVEAMNAAFLSIPFRWSSVIYVAIWGLRGALRGRAVLQLGTPEVRRSARLRLRVPGASERRRSCPDGVIEGASRCGSHWSPGAPGARRGSVFEEGTASPAHRFDQRERQHRADQAAECAQGPTFVTDGTVTIGTDNPAYPPVLPGRGPEGVGVEDQRPQQRQGLRERGGISRSRLDWGSQNVAWVAVPFAKSYAPGAKDFDFDLNQISYKPSRAQAVDFSTSYYDVNQALVAVKGTPITQATSVSDLKPYKLAAPLGTTSYDTITNVIQPTTEPGRLPEAVGRRRSAERRTGGWHRRRLPDGPLHRRPLRPAGEEQRRGGAVREPRGRVPRVLRCGPGEGQFPHAVCGPRARGDEGRRDPAGHHEEVVV